MTDQEKLTSIMMDQETCKLITETARKMVKQMAAELCSVQPMSDNLFSELMKYAKEEKELVEEGYEPVCESTKLMWVKKEK